MSSPLQVRALHVLRSGAVLLVLAAINLPELAGQDRGPTVAPPRTSRVARARTAARQPPLIASSVPSEQIYRAHCLECHDCDGSGGFVRDSIPEIPDFTDPQWQSSRTDANLSRSILEGKGKSMRPMKGKLDAVTTTRLVAFVRGFRGGKQVVSDETAEKDESVGPQRQNATAERLRAASALYMRNCQRCHGADGRGTEMRAEMPRIPDFSLTDWQKTRNANQLMVSILEGKGTSMPPFRGKVSVEQARDLAALSRTFAPSAEPPPDRGLEEFEAQFNELRDRFEELKKQFESLTRPQSKP